ncbi:molybdopterin-binding protein [Vulcanisaeta souniana]|uniref:Molybdopterin-binding protein n=1 Tax=Vulcanisaeta souniana JCM 11219 TaxID=1293586 RepID=A0A830EB96_9CREN|nr:molybdopterin-binding protein [Vulcanisaeta souniana]BDR93545.1 molybdopterin-binding protein [Vulcanisaeta souniana JCM 11219]GGI87358.1 molybdopterin-binding protein [Vulcanisaeta souniana JCM 11219]
MRLIRVEDSVGQVLGYDTTYVGRDGATVLLPRGHVITKDDVERLRDSGVYFVWVEGNEESSDLMYEWEVSERVARAVAGDNTYVKPARQGSAWIMSSINGVLRVDINGLVKLNLSGNALLITKQDMNGVVKDELVGIIDVIPLSMQREEVEELLRFGNLINVVPFRRRRIGVIITGTEIYQGRKKDLYYPIIRARTDKYGWEIVFNTIVPDDEDKIMSAMKEAINNGAEALVITGGMSVDPTDKTPIAIRRLGAKVIAYGVPIKPTTMVMIALLNEAPILAVSAGGIYYSDYNAIDIFLPRLMADLVPSREEIAAMGHGGLLPSYKPEQRT